MKFVIPSTTKGYCVDFAGAISMPEEIGNSIMHYIPT